MLIWDRNRLILAAIAAMALALTGLGGGSVAAQDGELTPVCVKAFEDAPHTEWLTDAPIEEINQLEQDPAEPPVPEIVGYPDPETGSCATENGKLKDYDPNVYTPVCVPSGPDRGGPLVVQWVDSIYAVPEAGVILADPETGACPGDEDASTDDEDTSGGDEDTGTGDDSREVSDLPRTGAGAMTPDASEQAAPIALLLVATVLFGAGVVTRRARLG
jgi:hypothetical protein